MQSSGEELKLIETRRIEINLFGNPQVNIPNSGADQGGRKSKKKSKRKRKRTRKN